MICEYGIPVAAPGERICLAFSRVIVFYPRYRMGSYR